MNSHVAVLRTGVLSDQLARTRLADAILVIAYAGFIGVSAQISVHLPFTPVPITGQTLAVLLGASALGAGRALMGSGLYLAAGLIGVPWFAGGSGGLSVASSPTFGYIVGFIAASALVGLMASRGMDKKVIGTAFEMVAGNLGIYAFGVAWLAFSLHISLAHAVALGVVPFLVGDLLKLVLAAVLLPGAWKVTDRLQAH
ncbi:MAG: biotin transporter BioY [Actinomycetota bacterium]|nr:biotin transporter BioY [Actinomycetota bacterium]